MKISISAVCFSHGTKAEHDTCKKQKVPASVLKKAKEKATTLLLEYKQKAHMAVEI